MFLCVLSELGGFVFLVSPQRDQRIDARCPQRRQQTCERRDEGEGDGHRRVDQRLERPYAEQQRLDRPHDVHAGTRQLPQGVIDFVRDARSGRSS